VLRACEELGLLPEIFVGTSAGAIVGAMYGQDIPLALLLDGYRLPWRRRHEGPRLHLSTFMGAPSMSELRDPGHLASGLFSIRRFERYMRRQLPINSFQRLAKPVFVTAVDIDSAERVVFGPGYDDRPPISEAVAASCCVPGLFRPILINGRYYVDGEVARTLSADIAVEAGANVVIISNIYRPHRELEPKRSTARKGMSQRYPHVTFIDIAPDLGLYGYLNRFAARSLILRGYGTALRALAAAKENNVFANGMPPESRPGLRSVS
jgi:NTE family protein